MLTNSPGEIGGWFIPLARKIKTYYPEIEIIAVLLPCQYASGTELYVLEDSGLFSRIVDRKDLLKFILSPSIKDEKKVILQLGGDPYWGTILKIRLKGKLFIYYDSMVHINKWADKIFLSDSRISKGTEKEIVVGNLLIDSIDTSYYEEGSTIAFLPGSRPYMLEKILPLMLETADIISGSLNIPVRFVISPFVRTEDLNKYIPRNFKLIEDRFISRSGNTFYISKGNDWSWTKGIQLAVNLPGTNTLQLALLGIPQITILPLQWADSIPLEGILEWIGRLPILGKKIKRSVVYRALPRIKFIALPNIISREKITDELIGEITPQVIAQRVKYFLENRAHLEDMKNRLKNIKILSGASDKIASIIGDELL